MKTTKKGFTLVELLVVIAILAILATVAVVGYIAFVDKANESAVAQELTQIRDAVIAEDITNPNFEIKNGKITISDASDPNSANVNDFIGELVTSMGGDRGFLALENNAEYLLYVDYNKGIMAFWNFANGEITTEEYDGRPLASVNFTKTEAVADSEIDSVGNTLANNKVIGDDKKGAVLPSGVKLEDGVSALTLSIKKVDNESNITLGEGDTAQHFDVHIEGIAADNDKPMIVYLGEVLQRGLSETELKLYHIENDSPVLMTRVNSVQDFAIHNQYVYNAETGEVTIYVSSFSVFSAVKTSADVWDGSTEETSWYDENATEFTLTTAEQFAGFRKLVDEGNTFAGKTVKLGVDIDLNNVNFDPIGYNYVHLGGQAFMGTFDGQGHTIYNLYQQGWDLESATGKDYTYSTAGGGLFASIKDATIKNLAVSGANIKMECVDMGIVVGYAQGTCHFENIIVTNSKIANYQRATGGVVGEVCFGPYGTDTSKGYSHTFTNIIVDSSVTVGSLWGDFDNLSGGVIGGKWGDATVKMENVIVAAELDVYSDVTAAYQWYAYRRCGMLIGHTEQNSPKSALNADAPFLTCENVNVYYGDWIHYNYYQFANQDSSTGQRYPWVRAEVGLNNGAFSNPRYGVPTFNGVKVTDMDEATFDNCQSGHAAITFNQLYGGGQGVYGKADHDGVKVNDLTTTKTIYFQNNVGWNNLKLQYHYKNGNDTWTTVVEGISLGEAVDTKGIFDIYKVTVPADVYAFTIIGENEGETTPEILMSGLVENHLYYVSGNEIQHRAYTGQYKTVYFQNNWMWTNVSLYYWFDDGSYDTAAHPGSLMTLDHNDGKYDIYRFDIPSNAKAFNINGIKNDGSGNMDQTPDIDVSSASPDYFYYMNYNNGNEVKLCPRIIYLVPDNNWKQGSARFAAYFFNDTTGKNTWVSMTYDSTKQAYKCNVPDGEWEAMIFCRMNPSTSANNWNNKWNQTRDLPIPSDGKNCGTIKISNSGDWDGSTTVTWSTK